MVGCCCFVCGVLLVCALFVVYWHVPQCVVMHCCLVLLDFGCCGSSLFDVVRSSLFARCLLLLVVGCWCCVLLFVVCCCLLSVVVCWCLSFVVAFYN